MIDAARYEPSTLTELADAELRDRYTELHELYREEYGQTEKANPYHDERGRFAESPVGDGAKPRWDGPPKDVNELFDRISILSKEEGGDYQKGEVIPRRLSHSGDMPAGINGVAKWDGTVVLRDNIYNDIQHALRDGELFNSRQAGAMKILRHETVHKVGIDRGQDAYNKAWGRVLEEGLTEHIAQTSWKKWTEDLGLKVLPTANRGLDMYQVYGVEVDYVRRLAGLAARAGLDEDTIIKKWKFGTKASNRPETIASYIADVYHPSPKERRSFETNIANVVRDVPGSISLIVDLINDLGEKRVS